MLDGAARTDAEYNSEHHSNHDTVSHYNHTNDDEADDNQLLDFIRDENSSSPEDIASHELLKEQMADVLEDVLTERERIVLQLRFGLGDGHQYPLEKVGEHLGVTRERVRQIEAEALRKLRSPALTEKFRDFL